LTARQTLLHALPQFTDFANQIIGVYEINADKIVDTYDNFAIEISSSAIASKSEWPFVTVPGFEAQGTRVQEQTGARTMAVSHFVQPEEKEAWLNYTMGNFGWIQESYDYQGSNETATPPPPFIWGDWRNFAPVPGPMEKYGIYAPYWQGAPITLNGGIVNFDSFR
jgi:hypothetical protein